jgi:hypothetical protein
MKVNVLNQCSDFKLTYQGYFCSGAEWNTDSNREIDTGSMKNADLTLSQATFGGILTHSLERKHAKISNLPDSAYILLLIAWKSEGYKKFRVFVHLIEYDKAFYWDKLSYKEYYQGYTNHLSTYTGPIKDTWLIPDGTVLATELELDFTQRDGVLNVTISEGIGDEHTRRPEWLNLER